MEASDDDIWTKEKQRRTKSSNEDLMIGDDVILGRFMWMPLPLPLPLPLLLLLLLLIPRDVVLVWSLAIGSMQYAVYSITVSPITNHHGDVRSTVRNVYGSESEGTGMTSDLSDLSE